MLQPNFFNSIFIIPILNLLIVFYKLIELAKLPGAFGLSIIVLTLFVRLLLHPFFKQQMETAKKMQDMKPHMDRISEKHKNDKQKLQEEQLKLYQQAGINPAAGCLTMLIQMPVFIGLYQTLNVFLTANTPKAIAAINKVLYSNLLHIKAIDPWFFGINLIATPQKAGHILYILIPIITGIFQYLQVQASTPAMGGQIEPAKKEGKEEKKEGVSEDFQKAMNTQMKYVFPIMIAWVSYSMPIGLSIYWNIFSLFSIIQYRSLGKAKKSL